jgi:hypothetical protein
VERPPCRSTHKHMLQPIAAEVAALGIGIPGFVFSITHTAAHLKNIAELIAPQGRLALINNEPLDLASFMRKSVSIHWESMFTRSLMETADMAEQHALLEQVAALVDSRKIRTTIAEHFGTINAANLKRAHAFLETGKARGKQAIRGYLAPAATSTQFAVGNCNCAARRGGHGALVEIFQDDNPAPAMDFTQVSMWCRTNSQ